MTAHDPFAALAARWDHGHTELTDNCALCQEEYAQARALAEIIACRPRESEDN
ncbi:MAG TPA: hypothetical protein VFG74_12740 [Miltoncostaeaceae bacterium]|nr:hypothetical protein [Miltoncostaeaceae bacterium]